LKKDLKTHKLKHISKYRCDYKGCHFRAVSIGGLSIHQLKHLAIDCNELTKTQTHLNEDQLRAQTRGLSDNKESEEK